MKIRYLIEEEEEEEEQEQEQEEQEQEEQEEEEQQQQQQQETYSIIIEIEAIDDGNHKVLDLLPVPVSDAGASINNEHNLSLRGAC